MSSTEVLIEKGILSSEDSHYTYKEKNYNASSNEENGVCLLTIASLGFNSLFKDSGPNPERDISFITNRFHYNLEQCTIGSPLCFQFPALFPIL